MRRSFWGVFFIATSLIISAYSSENVLSVFENAHTNTNLTEHLQNGLTELGINFDSEIPENRLAAIHFVLRNTYENNIHKMRGEEDNQVYTKDTGEEAVFDGKGNLVTNEWNKGSFNYGSYDEPIDKFALDIWPWLILGNSRKDPTTFDERFYHYLWDLDYGIQEYLFLQNKKELKKIVFSELDEMEILIYHFFNYLLFNDDYEFDLSEHNLQQYRQSSDNYWKYLSQLFVVSGWETP